MRSWRATIVAILLGIVAMAPAQADTVYAYWSYWQGDSGTWKYALVGPATSPAIDGAVDGWRFTLGSDGKAAQPAPTPDFAAICGDTAKQDNAVRVAVIVDSGGAATAAPTSYCAIVETGLSRMSALGTVTNLRLSNGFICAVNGVPESGCGDAVEAPTATPLAAAKPTRSHTTIRPVQPTSSATEPAVATGTSSADTTTPAMTAASPRATQAPADAGDQSSPLSTVVTMILAGIVMALALRNARRQQAAR